MINGQCTLLINFKKLQRETFLRLGNFGRQAEPRQRRVNSGNLRAIQQSPD